MQKLPMPLLLPTASFVAGCVCFGAWDIDIIAPLITMLIGGAFVLWRGWSAALLIFAFGVGGVRMSLSDANLRSTTSHASYTHSAFEGVNSLAQSRLDDLQLSPRAESLSSAMVLGNRDGITYAQRREYGLSGASHVLAVSGLHLSVIFLLLNILLMPIAALPRGHIIKGLVIIVLVWAYGAIVGFTPSVVRSVLMFSLFQLAWVWGRAYSGMNALLLAVLIGVGIAPEMLYSVGFQLSVVSVASIFLWGLPLYYRFFGGGGAFVLALCIGFGCSVATMPIASHVFGYVPLLGVFFSPLFVLCAFVIVSCGVVWIVLPLGILAPIVRFVMEVAAMLLDNTARWVAHKGWGAVEWRASWVDVLLIYLIYIVITLLVWSKKDE